MTPTFRHWQKAHTAACAAERALFDTCLRTLTQGGQPASAVQREEVRCLRDEASSALAALLGEIGRQQSKLRHDMGSIDFAMRMARRSSQALWQPAAG